MQRDAVEPILADGFGRKSHLFNRAGAIVAAAGTGHRNLRRISFAGLDEEILADANRLCLIDAGDVINAVAIHLDGAVIDVILAAAKLDLLSAVELELAAWQGAVGRDIEFRLGSDDGAQIAADLRSDDLDLANLGAGIHAPQDLLEPGAHGLG